MFKNYSKNLKKYILIIGITAFLLSFINITTVQAANIEIILNTLEVKQGEIIKATLKSDTIDLTQDKYTAEFAGRNFSFYIGKNNTLSSIIAVSYWTESSIKNLRIKQNDKYIYHKNIKVINGDFPESWIEVEEEKEKLVRPDEKDKALNKKLKEDNEKVARARSNSSQQKLYSNNFVWPLEGTISTEFGATRYVNGRLQSRHSGIDIAADAGTDVMASNAGIVTLATNLTVTGKTIIIDHGQGIFSSYAHLNKMNVKKGEQINKGEKIGEIGSTGFSTGPHLHWTIKVSNIYVNPRSFIN